VRRWSPKIQKEKERSFIILSDHKNNRKIVLSWPLAMRRQNSRSRWRSLIITTRKNKRLLLYYTKSYFPKQRVDNNYIRKSRGNSISLKNKNLSFMTIDLIQNFTIQRTYNNVNKKRSLQKNIYCSKCLRYETYLIFLHSKKIHSNFSFIHLQRRA